VPHTPVASRTGSTGLPPPSWCIADLFQVLPMLQNFLRLLLDCPVATYPMKWLLRQSLVSALLSDRSL
jgi:hypothetical protein